jgi:uncharacterized protein (TIGR02246 family)
MNWRVQDEPRLSPLFKKRTDMKLTTLNTVLAAILLTTSQAVLAYLSPEAHSAIELSSKKWVETYNQNNWDGLAALFTPDAIMMPPNGPVVKGREAIARWEKANETGFRIAFKLEAIEGQKSIAYVRGRSCVFIPDGNGGYNVDVGKFLEVRKRQSNGEWLIEADIFNSDLGLGVELLETCPFADLPKVAQ